MENPIVTQNKEQKKDKNNKSETYRKCVRLVIDDVLANEDYGKKTLEILRNENFNIVIKSLPEKLFIFWQRLGEHDSPYLSLKNNELCLSSQDWLFENQVVRLTNFQDIKTFSTLTYSNSTTNLGISQECRYSAIVLRNSQSSSKQNYVNFAAPIELQILKEIYWHVLDIEDLAQLLARYTKSVCEIPFKKHELGFNFGFKNYLTKSKNCVRIVGSNGLNRLWQQHLTILPTVSLEAAQTIIAKYSCPKKLLDQFAVCSNSIKPPGNESAIGDVLSKKLHTLYNSRDPTELL